LKLASLQAQAETTGHGANNEMEFGAYSHLLSYTNSLTPQYMAILNQLLWGLNVKIPGCRQTTQPKQKAYQQNLPEV